MDNSTRTNEQKWPDMLWLVRHGESAGNVAREAAEARAQGVIDLALRDADVPLSELGRRQAEALGRWFGCMPADECPTVILTSPYMRARQTTELLVREAGYNLDDVAIFTDERLREKEFGILDGLTILGVEAEFPQQAEFRRRIGKFYHRPPGGESWCDVILRLRSVVDTITREYRRERVLIVAHQVVVLCMRYLMERMTEEEILLIGREYRIANCSVTSYEYDRSIGKHGKMVLRLFNFVAPLEEAGEPVTSRPDVPVAPK